MSGNYYKSFNRIKNPIKIMRLICKLSKGNIQTTNIKFYRNNNKWICKGTLIINYSNYGKKEIYGTNIVISDSSNKHLTYKMLNENFIINIINSNIITQYIHNGMDNPEFSIIKKLRELYFKVNKEERIVNKNVNSRVNYDDYINSIIITVTNSLILFILLIYQLNYGVDK